VFGNVPVYNIGAPNRLYTDMGVVRELFSGEQAWYRAYTLETHKLAVGNSKVTWDFSYTWSKAIDQDTNERSTSTSFLYDPFNPKLSQGPSDNDVRHRLVGDITYRLPLGFLVSGIWTWRSGLPYTAGISFSGTAMNINGLTQTTGNLPVFVDSTNTIIDLTRASTFTRPQFADFLNSQGAHLLGRNKQRQAEWWDADLRVAKIFNITHGMQVEVLGEMFNLFNTRNKFVISSRQNMFNVAYTAATDKYTITRTSIFGLQSGYDLNSDPRQFQVAAKIIF
jgi:hypothetical protein